MIDAGPAPIPPENVTVTEYASGGAIVSWNPARKGRVAIAYYTVDYCYDDQWSRLSRVELKPTDTHYIGNPSRRFHPPLPSAPSIRPFHPFRPLHFHPSSSLAFLPLGFILFYPSYSTHHPSHPSHPSIHPSIPLYPVQFHPPSNFSILPFGLIPFYPSYSIHPPSIHSPSNFILSDPINRLILFFPSVEFNPILFMVLHPYFHPISSGSIPSTV